MPDFAINKKGDLLFEEKNDNSKSINVQFIISENRSLNLNFSIERTFPLYYKNNSIKLSFFIDDNKKNKVINITDGESEQLQDIYIALQTTLGELANRKDFGSKLELVRHKTVDLNKSNAFYEYIKVIKEATKDIVPNCTIYIEPYINRSINYTEGLIVYIVDNDTVLTKYIIRR